MKRILEKADLFQCNMREVKGSGREESELASIVCDSEGSTVKDPCFMVYISFCISESEPRSWIVRVLWGAQKFKIIMGSGQALMTRKLSDFKLVLGPLLTQRSRIHCSINLVLCVCHFSQAELRCLAECKRKNIWLHSN